MRLDFRSPSTYFVLALCFFVGFFSFFLFRSVALSTAQVDPKALQEAEKQQQPQSSKQAGSTNSSEKSSEGFNPEASIRGESSKASAKQAKQKDSKEDEPQLEVADPSQSVAFPRVSTPAQSSTQSPVGISASIGQPAIAFSNQPKHEIAWADPSNYGERYKTDIYKRPANNQPIIVLHETVGPASSVIAYFKSFHANEADQASYHTMIRRNGTVVYMVPPEKRAFGAGNSVFVTEDGEQEAVKTHKKYPPSVNNFAYHISLESPPDGYGNESAHSGYTQAQYDSLAWLIGQSTVPLNRITTHRAVDRSSSRSDPRSFEVNRLIVALRPYR